MSDNKSQKVALITGANKGIGFETARQLGKQGIKVLIRARDEERGLAVTHTRGVLFVARLLVAYSLVACLLVVVDFVVWCGIVLVNHKFCVDGGRR